MPEASNGLTQPETSPNDLSGKLGPRDFIFKNLKYIPWIIICGAIALVLAFLKIRYSTPIYLVQSSMVISGGGGNARGDRFDAMMMAPDAEASRTSFSVTAPTPEPIIFSFT